ncbi:MAG: ZIP family metal transporter [Defluviitaleaceae bacterium]|nr:ZIP family metal transporter [Defluviitaleaceae bacterium]
MNSILMALMVLAMGTWLAAALGASMVVFIKKGNCLMTCLVLGFAAGVILMVSFVELIHPAIHMAQEFAAIPAWVVVPGAFAVGFFGAFLLDRHINRVKARRERAGQGGYKYKQGVMLIGALSVHSIPEGLALGILLGAVGNSAAGFLTVMPIAIAVGLHKLPEGTAISVAFQEEGMGKFKSFLLGQVSGFFGFLTGFAGFMLAISVDAILPYAMAFAGGAMVWVAVHELIPASRKCSEKKPYLATIGVFLGILLMLFVDTTLHDHNHGCGPNCRHEMYQQLSPTRLGSRP